MWSFKFVIEFCLLVASICWIARATPVHRAAPFCVHEVIRENNVTASLRSPVQKKTFRDEDEALEKKRREAGRKAMEPGLQNFQHIFQYFVERGKATTYYHYIPVAKDETSPSNMVSKFKLTPIKVDDTDSGYTDTLRNRLHIDFKSRVPLQGLYVQAMSAPWGIPFGVFEDFECGDCGTFDSSIYVSNISIIPCRRRPAFAFEHPNVFTVGGLLDSGEEGLLTLPMNFTEMHFNFRFTQYPCVEHTYAQFLIIAVREFSTWNHSAFETYYTPVYKLDIQENPSGAYYPYFPGWKKKFLQCHSSDPLKITGFETHAAANERLKIRHNTVFDECVRNYQPGTGEWQTCPPGPIDMAATDIPADLAAWTTSRGKYSLVGNPLLKVANSDDAQFCYDAGTWEWTLGKLAWPKPNGLVVDPKGEALDDSKSEVVCPKANQKPVRDETTGELYCHENRTIKLITNRPPPKRVHKGCDDKLSNKFDIFNNTCEGHIVMEYTSEQIYLNYSPPVDCRSLTFTDEVNIRGIRWGHRYVIPYHGKFLVFTWTVVWNLIAFSGRFMKEQTVIHPRSIYGGIGVWLWLHLILTYIGFGAMLIGLMLMMFQVYTKRVAIGDKRGETTNLHDLCALKWEANSTTDVLNCLSDSKLWHEILGWIACTCLVLGYISGWFRPVNPFMRMFLIIYHYAMAWLGKVIFYGIILLGYFQDIIGTWTVICVILCDAWSLFMWIVATSCNCFMDKKFVVKKRKYCPVPEGIEPIDAPSYKRFVWWMFPVNCIGNLVCFMVGIQAFVPHEDHNLCIRTQVV